MACASLGCAVTAQETNLKPLRTSLAPHQRAATTRRSADVAVHVLSAPSTPNEPFSFPPSRQSTGGLDAAQQQALLTANWAHALQTKFHGLWSTLSAKLSKYKHMHMAGPHWSLGSLLEQAQAAAKAQLRQPLTKAAAAATAVPSAAVNPLLGGLELPTSRPVLAPYLTAADDVEVSFAAMLADLCNMAYDVAAMEKELVESRHGLTVVASSATACASNTQPAAAAGAATPNPEPAAMDAAGLAHSEHAGGNAPAAVNGYGSSPSLTPSISLVQLTSPEAVTAALTSTAVRSGYPVYMSSLHQALTSMGSCDEDDISDLEWRQITAADPTSPNGDDRVFGGAQHLPGGTVFFCDADLSEERDFLAGGVYGYNTPLVERRSSSSSGAGDAPAGGVSYCAVPSAVTASGSEGGKALREQQERPRKSSQGAAGGFGADAEGVAATAPPAVLACSKPPPSAWFACDDALTKTRYFAIQGSTSLEHWQINLQFEPVVFEDPEYGVRIHRGVYEAAKTLYDDLLPLVQQHVQSSPYATVSFTGHSLGGSLSTVLLLLFVTRGVLTPANVSPVYTYGAPAVFCQGAAPGDRSVDHCCDCDLPCEMHGKPHHHAAADDDEVHLGSAVAAAAATPSPEAGLLARLGLSEDHVVNVIMHKDIVPRAFVCDYTAVVGVLQRWWPSFRDHSSLREDAGPHKALYNFIGRIAVLRPSEDLPFVHGPADAAHPMLPNLPALYRVALPEEGILPLMDHAAASLASWDELLDGTALAAAMQVAQEALHGCVRDRLQARLGKLAALQRNVLEFMNQPHPLTTLSDYQAYGPRGCISRFHNPDNYTRALEALLRR